MGPKAHQVAGVVEIFFSHSVLLSVTGLVDDGRRSLEGLPDTSEEDLLGDVVHAKCPIDSHCRFTGRRHHLTTGQSRQTCRRFHEEELVDRQLFTKRSKLEGAIPKGDAHLLVGRLAGQLEPVLDGILLLPIQDQAATSTFVLAVQSHGLGDGNEQRFSVPTERFLRMLDRFMVLKQNQNSPAVLLISRSWR